jgi:tetratricopeptide (TPR) repeat protein
LWPLVGVGVLVLALAGAASWWFLRGRNEQLYADGVAAYTRGAREVARAAFVELAQRTPDDARPLVYLGRMSREDADNARAKRFLTTAVRVAPTSAVAQRELGSVMLADGQPELARRFYVHALELDPTDRTAQGFLGCALARLQRMDEAQRWLARAGAGEWQRCVAPPPMPLPTSQPPR